MKTTKEFTEKLKREIEEIRKYYTDEIVRMLRRYKYDFEKQIEDEEKYSKRMVDEYEKKLWDEVDEKTIGLNENDNDEDDYDTIQQLGLEVGLNVESMVAIEKVRLDTLNKTRDEKIVIIELLLDYYENL